jgi:hypothetical protein
MEDLHRQPDKNQGPLYEGTMFFYTFHAKFELGLLSSHKSTKS